METAENTNKNRVVTVAKGTDRKEALQATVTTDKTAAPKRKSPAKPQPTRLSDCKTVPELRNYCNRSPYVTNKFDLLLIKGGRMTNIRKNFERIRGNFRDFRTLSKIRAHLKYREQVDGWVFSYKDKNTDNLYVKVRKVS